MIPDSINYMYAQVLMAPLKLEYRKIPIPEYGKDEVLVKTITAAVCNGSDPNLYKGYISMEYPYVFGHETYGEVVACGLDINGIKVGDRISWWFSTGAFAQYVVVNPSKAAIAKLPSTISKEEAPIMELVLASARAVKAAGIKKSSRILILGLGPSGLIMSQLFKIFGASKVVGWDLYPMRRNKGCELGCDAVFDSADKKIQELTSEVLGKVDIIIDAMGNDILPGEPTLEKAMKILDFDGKIISYGHPSNGRRFNPYQLQSRRAIICGPEQDITEIRKYTDECIRFIVEGKLNLKPLVSMQLPLYRVKEGLMMVMEHPGEVLKIIINTNEVEED